MLRTICFLALPLLALPVLGQERLKTAQFPENQAYLQFEGAPLYWPSTPRPQLIARPFILRDDNVELPRLAMNGSGFELVASQLELPMSPRPQARYSIYFQHNRAPSLGWSVSYFRSNEFVTSVNAQSLMAYAKGLLTRRPDKTEVRIIEGPADGIQRARFPILGDRPLRIVYDFITYPEDEDDTSPPTIVRRVDYFSETDAGVAVLSYHNSQFTFERVHRELIPFFTSIDMLEYPGKPEKLASDS